MRRTTFTYALLTILAASTTSTVVSHAQATGMDHAAHLHGSAGPTPASPGQAAHGAIAEIVRLLEADPSTDWSRVDIGALRQHLLDMDDVMLRSRAVSRNIAGGIQVDVTGDGRVAEAIQRMLTPHSAELDASPELSAQATSIAGGVRLVVTAESPNDAATVAKVRGLGVYGLLTVGDHHAPHHLAIARGVAVHAH